MTNPRTISRAMVAWILASAIMLTCCSSPNSPAQSPQPAEQETATQAAPEAQAAPADQITVSYLGPEGTYTQEACELFFDGQGTYLPQADVAASVQAVVDGTSAYAVIPQENTIGGPVAEYLDEVISHEGVSVVGEVELPISQNLLAKPGTALDGIKTVYSHKQGLAQGKAWLQDNLPNAELVEVSSTAEGARMAADAQAGDCAAIGSSAAAGVYGLEVVAADIQMSDTNKTRFYVLSTKEPAQEASDRMAFVATGAANDLPALLAKAQEQGLTIIGVHDRPEKTELGRYHYLIECAGGGYEQFSALEKACPLTLRYLGSFAVRTPQEGAGELAEAA